MSSYPIQEIEFQKKQQKKSKNKKTPEQLPFKPKQDGKGREIVKIKNKKNRFEEFLPNPKYRIPKKFNKLNNTIMASFQEKIGWERLRKRENKKNRSDEFISDPEQRIPKKQKKNSKN